MPDKAKRVICKSGVEGWQCRLRDNYENFTAFSYWAEMYGLAKRLGFKTIEGAWRVNPVIQGSSVPSDFRRVM